MISNIFRKLLSLLSFFLNNNLELIKKKDNFINYQINKKLNKLTFEKRNLKKTHSQFNLKLFYLLQKNNLTHFLRNGFIQKMFFIHNRLFIFNELIELKKKIGNFIKS